MIWVFLTWEMECRSPSSKEKAVCFSDSPRVQYEGMASPDSFAKFLGTDDPIAYSPELMSFDSYAGWCASPLGVDQMFASFSLPAGFTAMETLNFTEQAPAGILPTAGDLKPSSFDCGDKYLDVLFSLPSEIVSEDVVGMSRGGGTTQQSNARDVGTSVIPRQLGRPLAEKMLKALALFKESTGGGILAQVWVPIKHGDQYMLSTCEQPYLLDQLLAGYREVSRGFTFSAEVKPGSFPGLPGRVFSSKVPEWTSNVLYYNRDEYLRIQHALNHHVRGSIALPVFEGDSLEKSCCAVLELVTMKEKPNFDPEIEHVCRALQAVNLSSTTPPRLYMQCLSRNQRSALGEITDVLRAVCHAHRLPLALTWIPCSYNEGVGDEKIKVRVKGCNNNSVDKSILCIEDTACYVNDKAMQGFVHACTEHYLEEGQGIAGKALQSNHPFFFPDVKKYDISEYPLVHHARKFGLNAAVAIRLRSTYTGDDDYILEFFLPVNMEGCTEQQLLLNNLSSTMQRICRSLRTVLDTELVGHTESDASMPQVAMSRSGSLQDLLDGSANLHMPIIVSDSNGIRTGADCPDKQVPSQTKIGSRRQSERKRSTAEKNVSLSILQQYFSGSLKDAAKSIGVCPTTLKRICRQHGISRWPSRKINKVNRSLKKIQTVLDSVEGVEGGLKFDPAVGGLVAAGSVIKEFDTQRNIVSTNENLSSMNVDSPLEEAPVPPSTVGKDSLFKMEDDSRTVALWSSSKCLSLGHDFQKRSEKCNLTDGGLGVKNDGMDLSMNIENGINEPNQATSSGMTESSNGSSTSGSSPSSRTFCGSRNQKIESSSGGGGSKFTVKATYKEDTVRFKFERADECSHLYEEVAKRFKLQVGTFQLKYLDDEEEWVLLVSDSDLQECVEILDFHGCRCVRFLVRDVACAIGSSGSSNCLLTGNT